ATCGPRPAPLLCNERSGGGGGGRRCICGKATIAGQTDARKLAGVGKRATVGFARNPWPRHGVACRFVQKPGAVIEECLLEPAGQPPGTARIDRVLVCIRRAVLLTIRSGPL